MAVRDFFCVVLDSSEGCLLSDGVFFPQESQEEGTGLGKAIATFWRSTFSLSEIMKCVDNL